jgi:type II restriction enzyme
MIWRLANAIRQNQPINVDRILGASYNTRSVLEALIAHTPQFHFCYPGRIESVNSNEAVKKGHKHLISNPWIFRCILTPVPEIVTPLKVSVL